MHNIELQLTRLATALESIAKSLNTNFIPYGAPTSTVPVSTPSNFITHSPMTPEEELFILTSNIYLDETRRKSAENMKRKSARKVSQELITMQINFLSKHLQIYTIAEHQNGVIVISKDGIPKALVRFYTDLGFHRGIHWTSDITDIVSMANSLNIPTSNIFLIVLSNANGLDNQHVCSTLNTNISNKDILDPVNLNILKNYCNLYANSFSSLLPSTSNQIFFLASNLHPNGIAEEIFNNAGAIIDLTTSSWVSLPLSNIFSVITTL